MNINLYTRFRDIASLRRLRDAQAIELHRLNGASHVLWQPLDQSPDVVAAFGADMIVVRNHFVGFIERHVRDRRLRAAQNVDQLVSCDSVHPWRQGLDRIISVPLDMDGEYCFLNQILCLRCPSSDG
jgi:hypothetical protein